MKNIILALCLVGSACAVCLCQSAPGINVQHIPFNPERATFEPEHQRPVTLETATMSAELISTSPDPVTGSSKAIRLKYLSKAKEALVHLPFDFVQVNAIRQGPAGRLIVLGMPTGDAYVIGILDTDTHRLIDKFTCYDPSISPNGHYIAFTKFFAPHFVPSPADHSMLYVVARSPQQNRPKGILLNDDEDVGFEVFPPGIGNWKADNIAVAHGSEYHLAGSYIWSGTDQYFFASGVAGQLSLVWVSIANGSAFIRTANIPKAREVSSSAPYVHLRKVDVTSSGVAATFSERLLNKVFAPEDFVSAGSVDLTPLPMGRS